MKISLFICALAVCLVSVHAADAPKAPVEMQKFAPLAGKWKLDEKSQASPFSIAGKATFESETALIYNGNFFRELGKGKVNDTPVEYTIITRYDPSTSAFRSVYYDSTGVWAPAKVTLEGKTIRTTGEHTINGKKYTLRSVSIFSEDGSKFDYHWEYSEDGTNWKTAFKGVGRRK